MGATAINWHKVKVTRFMRGLHFLLKFLTYVISVKIYLLSTAGGDMQWMRASFARGPGVFRGVRDAFLSVSSNEYLHKKIISIFLII